MAGREAHHVQARKREVVGGVHVADLGQLLHLADGGGRRVHRRRRDERRVDAVLRERAVEHAQPLGVVRVVVRDEHGRERKRIESHGVTALEQCLLRDAAVDKDGGVAQPHESGIALAAAGEHVQHEAVGVRRSVHVTSVRRSVRVVGVRKIVRIVTEKSVRIVSVGKDTRATSTRTAACVRGTVRRFSRSGRILREHSARNAIRSPMRRAFRRSVLRAHALDMLARKGLALAPCIELPLSRRTRSVPCCTSYSAARLPQCLDCARTRASSSPRRHIRSAEGSPDGKNSPMFAAVLRAYVVAQK